MSRAPVFQFHARLLDCSLPVWRQVQILGSSTLARLGCAVLCMFEMRACHPLFLRLPLQENMAARGFPPRVWSEFEPSARYAIPGPQGLGEEDDPDLSDARIRLRECLRKPGEKVFVDYDTWTVELRLEEILRDPELSGRQLPRVTAGQGLGILEDCGGPVALAALAEPLSRGEGPEYARYRELLGLTDLDLNHFDLEDMNLRLRRLPRIFSEMYEYGIPPTRRSQDFLDRTYLHRP